MQYHPGTTAAIRVPATLLPALLLASAVLIPGLQPVAASEREDSAEPRVSVTVLRTERAGRRPQRDDEHVVTQVFWVSSESSRVNLSCVVSELTIQGKEGEQAARQVLSPSVERGCQIEVPGAVAPIGGGHLKVAALNDTGRASDGVGSDYVTFQSLDGQGFAQDVYVTAYWRQQSSVQLSGTYEGAIKLEARMPDELEPPK